MRVRWLAVSLALAAVLFMIPSAADAAGEITVVQAGSSTGNTPGTRLEISNQTVDAELVGNLCTGVLTTRNNESVHPGNNVHVTTAGVEYTLPDVESGSGLVTTAEGAIVMGETLLVELEFGEDGATSGGLTLTLTCVDPAPPEPPTPTPPDFTG